MALAKFGVIVTDLRGKINGHVFSSSRGGAVLKGKPKKPYLSGGHGKEADGFVAFTSSLQVLWQNLTAAQRDQWNVFARTVQRAQKRTPSLFINGYEYFIKYNSWRLMAGLSALSVPSYTNPVETSLWGYPGIHEGKLSIIMNRGVTQADEFFLAYLSNVTPPTWGFRASRLTFMSYTLADANTFDISVPAAAKWGVAPALGDIVHYRFIHCSTAGHIISDSSGHIIELETYTP